MNASAHYLKNKIKLPGKTVADDSGMPDMSMGTKDFSEKGGIPWKWILIGVAVWWVFLRKK